MSTSSNPRTVVVSALLLLATAFTGVAFATVARSSGAGESAKRGDSVSRWAYLLRPVVARAAPSPTARRITRIAARTPEGANNLVVVLGKNPAADGYRWVRVRLAILPNGSTGWIRRNALGDFHVIHTQLELDREQLTLTLYRRGRQVFRARVGIGQPQWPTPPGRFYVRERLAGFDDPFYGPIAFGTSGRSRVLTDWPGGGFIGIHGTSLPQLIPGRISHGCIRLRNGDIVRLARLLPLGTPFQVT